MRLWIGVWPPPAVLDALTELPRPADPAVRWTTRSQWHVTLRFLGEVDETATPSLWSALDRRIAGAGPRSAVAGPAVTWLGRPRESQLVVPVSGLEGLAAEVASATAAFGRPPERRAFAGHLTLGRVRRGGRPGDASDLAGAAFQATWLVDQVELVSSDLAPHGAEYETLAEIPL